MTSFNAEMKMNQSTREWVFEDEMEPEPPRTVKDVFWFFTIAQELHLNLRNEYRRCHYREHNNDNEPLNDSEIQAAIALYQYVNAHFEQAYNIHPSSVKGFSNIMRKYNRELPEILRTQTEPLSLKLTDLIAENKQLLDTLIYDRSWMATAPVQM